MLRTFTRFFNFNFVIYTLYFISLFNLLSWSFHGVHAAPVRASVGPEEWEIGIFLKASGHSLATVAGQIYVFQKLNGLHHVARDSGLDDYTVSASDTTSAMPFTSTEATATPSSPSSSTLDSSMSTPWTSPSTTSSCTPVASSSSFRLGTGVPSASSDISPPTASPVVVPSVTPVVTSPPISATTEGLPPVMPPASSETFITTLLPPIVTSLLPLVPPVITSLPPPVVALSSSPVVPVPSSVTRTSQSAASQATVTSPAGRPTSTMIVSVTPVTPEPSPTTTSTSSAPNTQSNPSSQQASSSPASSPSAQSDAVSSSQLSGSLIAIITVLSFFGTLSLVLGVIVFFRTRHRRIIQTRLLEERQPSPPNLSSRFSVSTTGSMEQSRRFTLFNSRPPSTTRSLLPRPTNPNDGVTSATTPLVYLQGLPDGSLETE